MIRALLALLLLCAPAAAQVVTPAPGVPAAQVPFNLNNVNIQAPPYNAKADTLFKTDGTVAASSAAFSSASSTFIAADVGKLISIPYVGSIAGATLNTTIATFVNANSVTLTTPATLGTTRSIIPGAVVATSQSGAGSYAPADVLTVSGGTSTTAATLSVATTLLASATVNAAGAGGTNGACTLTGTTGTGTKFVIQATITANAISALGTVTIPGVYTVNPTSIAAEPVTSSCGLTGATLVLKMGVNTVSPVNVGVYTVIPGNPVATTTGGSGTGATLTVGSITPGNFSYGTDNATGLQAAITAAQAAGLPTSYLYVPAAPSGKCYGYTPPLTISANLDIVGDWVSENWGGGINVPLTSPQVLGSVLCPISNGQDAMDGAPTVASLAIGKRNIGILFQAPMIGTGDAFHYIPNSQAQGLSGAVWNNVVVYGHDGNHYAMNLQNPIYNTFVALRSYGGGVANLVGSSSTGFYGNSVFEHGYGQVIAGGSANGFTFTSNTSGRLNLITLLRPQAIVDSNSAFSPPGNPPTSAQWVWNQDALTKSVKLISPDFETNIGSSCQFGAQTAGFNNDIDPVALNSTCSTFNLPFWGQNGVWDIFSRFWNDTTSSGATGGIALAAFPGWHLTANSATTYSVASTIYVAPPIPGTNVSFTRTASIESSGQIHTTAGGFASDAGGMFNTGVFSSSGGNSTLNKSSNFTTEIGDGTSNGTVTIGGASNTTVIGSTLSVTGVSTVGTIAGSVCMTSANLLLYESGATGCTISRADLKNIDGPMTVEQAHDVLMALQPISFAFKETPDKKRLGFTAENVQSADPRLATFDGNGDLQAYDPNGLIAVLTVAAKDQERRIDEQRLWLIALSIVVLLLAGSQTILWRRRV